MTSEREHKARHIKLHNALDELLADYLLHNRRKLLRSTSAIALAEWSYQQTLEPTVAEEEVGD